MNKPRIYSHKHFGLILSKVLEISESGFIYRGNEYQWADIKRIARYDSFHWTLFFYHHGYPLSVIYLVDGKKIYLQGRILIEEGKDTGFNWWHPTIAYNELVSFIEAKIKELV